jgi:hypothetical protein
MDAAARHAERKGGMQRTHRVYEVGTITRNVYVIREGGFRR